MAVGDLMVLIFEVILYEIVDGYFSYSFLNHTPVCKVILTLLFVSVDCSVWLTVAFTFDRFITICHQVWQTKYCTEKTAAVVIGVVCFLSILENVPWYFIYEPREVIGNVAWSCYVKSSFYILHVWVAFLWLETVLTPFAPFVLILMLNSLTIRHILLANRVRSGLRGKKGAENQTDPEMENRRRSIILLLAISGSFLLFWAVNLICYVQVQFTDTQFLQGTYNDPFTIAELTGYMLKCMSSCTNTFIYAVSQRKFREELQNVFKWPLLLIINVVNFMKQKMFSP
ncbi:putative G-protein coupled receptor 139 [Rhinoraja longicauda]